jgi:hypothetical protein
VRNPERMEEMIRQVREMEEYTTMPIVINEDDQPWRHDHQGWGESGNNFAISVKNYASWGNFDFRRNHEHHDYNLGHQSIPANYHITTEREKGFFNLLADITGSPGHPPLQLNSQTTSETLKVIIEGERLDSPITKGRSIGKQQSCWRLDSKPFLSVSRRNQ